MYTALPTENGPRSRAESAYVDLRHRLLMGDFPVVDRLAEERLAALVGVSRTPVREALVRLHLEGLVERHPEGGYRPALPNLSAIHELYEVRISLERTAMARPRHTGQLHDHQLLVALREEWKAIEAEQPEPEPSFVVIDEGFHVGLAEAAGNAQLVELLELVNARIRLVRMHDFLTPERIAATVAQHLGIVDALLAGDLVLAERRLDTHLGESMTVVEERAARSLARMLGREGGIR